MDLHAPMCTASVSRSRSPMLQKDGLGVDMAANILDPDFVIGVGQCKPAGHAHTRCQRLHGKWSLGTGFPFGHALDQ